VAAGRGAVVRSATPPGAPARATGGITATVGVADTDSGENNGAEGIVIVGAETTGNDTTGVGNTGTETAPADRGSGWGCAVITSTITTPPAKARQLPAASRVGQRRGGLYCRCLAGWGSTCQSWA
jgi:hypothetical protein